MSLQKKYSMFIHLSTENGEYTHKNECYSWLIGINEIIMNIFSKKC